MEPLGVRPMVRRKFFKRHVVLMAPGRIVRNNVLSKKGIHPENEKVVEPAVKPLAEKAERPTGESLSTLAPHL